MRSTSLFSIASIEKNFRGLVLGFGCLLFRFYVALM